jgi:hemolysin activation/secretion protein
MTTPHKYRRPARSGAAWPLAGLLLASLSISAAPASAQTMPDAGRLLDDIQPPRQLPKSSVEALPAPLPRAPLQLPADIKVQVETIRITGAQAFAVAELQGLVADLTGGQHSLAELEQGAMRITQHYREAGYMLARAYLPTQEIKNGVVDIQVLEGRLGKLSLNNQSGFSDERIREQVAGITPDQALRSDTVERGLLLLSDIPGLVVRSTLSPGASLGTTDLDIQVKNGKPYDANVSVDNLGNRYTGEARINGSATLNNPFGLGDALQFNALSSGSGLVYGRLSYQLPINRQGTQVGVAYAQMRYRLGEEFSNLDAHGTARIASFYLLHPLLRSRQANLNLQINFDHKELDDNIDLTATTTSKTLNNLSVGLSGYRNDDAMGGGISHGSLSVTTGKLKLDAESAALDALGHNTQGNFVKSNIQLGRLQRLSQRWNLSAQLNAQYAGNNLTSTEKMSLGGAYGVRAYPQGEAPADDAWLLNLELRYDVTPQTQALLFYDSAEGRLNHKPVVADGNNRRSLSGVGTGIRWAGPQGLSLQASVAWRTDDAPNSDKDKTPRAWLQIAKRF